MWIAFSARYPVFFGKLLQKASGRRHRVFLSKKPREKLLGYDTQSSSARYPGKSFECKISSLPQHATLDGLRHKLSSPCQYGTTNIHRHWYKILHSELAAYDSAFQGSSPQQFGQKHELLRTQVSAPGIKCPDTHASILWTWCQGHSSHSYDDTSMVRIQQIYEYVRGRKQVLHLSVMQCLTSYEARQCWDNNPDSGYQGQLSHTQQSDIINLCHYHVWLTTTVSSIQVTVNLVYDPDEPLLTSSW